MHQQCGAETIAFSDHLAQYFRPDAQDPFRLLPFEWFREAADPDSSGNLRYWTAYAQHLGIGQLIFCEAVRDDSIKISSWKSGSLTALAVLNRRTAYDDSVIVPITENIAGILGFGVVAPAVTLPMTDNLNFWNGRSMAVIDSHRTALRYYNQIPTSMQNTYTILKKIESLIGAGEQLQIAGGNPQLYYLEAESLLETVSSDSLFVCEWLTLQSHLRINQAAWTRAEQAVRALMKRCGASPELYLLISRMHPERFKELGFRNRKQLFEKALALNPACVRAYMALGDWYYFQQKMKEAESVYWKLLRINPRSYDGLMALGKIYLYRAETLKLIEILEQVRQFYPGRPEVIYNLGIAYYNQNDMDQAARLFRLAAESYNYPDAYYYLGAVCMKQGNYSGAVDAFRKRIAFRKGNQDTYADEAVKQLYRLLNESGFTESAHDSTS